MSKETDEMEEMIKSNSSGSADFWTGGSAILTTGSCIENL